MIKSIWKVFLGVFLLGFGLGAIFSARSTKKRLTRAHAHHNHYDDDQD